MENGEGHEDGNGHGYGEDNSTATQHPVLLREVPIPVEANAWHTNVDGHIELATLPDIHTHATCTTRT